MFIRVVFVCAYFLLLLFIFSPSHADYSIEFLSCSEVNCSAVLYQLLDMYPENHYCAFYDFKDQQLLSLLNTKTLIFDEEYEELHARFIPVASKGLMHHKIASEWIYVKNSPIIHSLTPIFKY